MPLPLGFIALCLPTKAPQPPSGGAGPPPLALADRQNPDYDLNPSWRGVSDSAS
jgi:hypothetical protein